MNEKQKTSKIIRVVAIGSFIGFFVWLLCAGVGTLFDAGESNSMQTNFTTMSFVGAMAGVVIGGMFTYANVKRALKK